MGLPDRVYCCGGGMTSGCSGFRGVSLPGVVVGSLSGSGFSTVADRSCEGWESDLTLLEGWDVDSTLDPLLALDPSSHFPIVVLFLPVSMVRLDLATVAVTSRSCGLCGSFLYQLRLASHSQQELPGLNTFSTSLRSETSFSLSLFPMFAWQINCIVPFSTCIIRASLHFQICLPVLRSVYPSPDLSCEF